jgi:hypothetical protein
MTSWSRSSRRSASEDADRPELPKLSRRRPPARPPLRRARLADTKRAAMHWVERYLVEGAPRPKHFAEVAADLAKREA